MPTPNLAEIKTLDPKAVFSVLEVARLLGMTHNGVLNRMKRGELSYGKSGHRYFISGAAVQKQIVMSDDIDI